MRLSSRVTFRRIRDILSRTPSGSGNRPCHADYTRYSNKRMQSDTSIEDQHRKNCEHAGCEISPELHFIDCGVSGAEPGREGLANMLEAAHRGEFSVLYVHSLSRLARDFVFTMMVMRWLVHCGIRIRSVAEGIDTNTVGWEVSTTVIAIFTQQALRELAENVRRGQEGVLANGFSLGDYPFGYTSVPDPGGATRKSRGVEVPRKVYKVVEEHAKWVRLIFHWFIAENRALSWIIQNLNTSGAPRDHRAARDEWTREAVISVLRNPKYIGIWPWGKRKNARNPITGQKFRELRPEEQIARWTRQFAHLRIIELSEFLAAQVKLDANIEAVAANRSKDGKLGGAAEPVGVPRHLLQTLLSCHACGGTYYVSGAHGKYLRCRGHRAGRCSQGAYLPRRLAEKAVLNAIEERMLSTPGWRSTVCANVTTIWEKIRGGRHDGIETLEKRLTNCDDRIRRLVSQIERSDDPIPEVQDRLVECRNEKSVLTRDITRQRLILEKVPEARPDEEWIIEQLADLTRVLKSQTPAASSALRGILRGPIMVEEVEEPNRVRKNFRLTLSLDSTAVISSLKDTEDPHRSDSEKSLGSVVVDVKRATVATKQLSRTWELLHEGKPAMEIAVLLGVSRSRMTAICKQLAEVKGIAAKELHAIAQSRRPARPKMAERLMPEVIARFQSGELIAGIAAALRCSRPIVENAIALWHEQRGLPVPDCRTRRKELQVKTRASAKMRRDVI